jgi:hypothetical protein
MKTKIICPALRPGVAGLARRSPLVLIPMLGSSPLGIHLAQLYAAGIREVELLAADRPEMIRDYVGTGEAWGLKVAVTPVAKETRMKDAVLLGGDKADSSGIFNSYSEWYKALRSSFASAPTGRAGMREIAPGIIVHTRSEISPDAKLTAPCWIGENTRIGPECQIGPGAYIEDDCVLEKGASVEESWVGPRTYVGQFIDVVESLAWGRWLCKWPTGTTTTVHDAFLLGEIPSPTRDPRGRLLNRFVAALAAIATVFVPVLGLALSMIRKRKFWTTHTAVMPDSSVVKYGALSGFDGLLSRWPRLFAIARGDFGWVGNPPLTPPEAGALLTQYERVWYSVRPGLFSLADAEGNPADRGEEAIAHATYFVATQSVSSKLIIIHRSIFRSLRSLNGHGNCTIDAKNEDLLRGPHPSRH